MDEDTSLGKIVQTIMENLSEAISQLILLVISLQEQNAVMPAHIPAGADGVCKASNTLADVASGLAQEEYEDYPEIQHPILEAAQDVRQSVTGLTKAIQFLSTSNDRVEGWAGLLEACRTISGQTCYILQLVYGAELKRLMMAAEAARSLAANTPSNMAAVDPQKFAEQVSDLAGHAEGMSNFLRDKAKDEESPHLRQEMEQAADRLEKLSNDLPALANNLIKDPKNPNHKKVFDEKVKELEKEIEKAMAPVNEKLRMLPDKYSPLGSAPPSKPTQPSGYRPNPEKLADKAKEDLRNIVDDLNRKDVPKTTVHLQEFVGDIGPLMQELEAMARESSDPERSAQLHHAAEDLKFALPKVLNTVQGQQQKPPKPADIPKVHKQMDRAIDQAKQVARPAPEVELPAVVRQLKNDIPELVRAAKRADPKAVEELSHRVLANQGKLNKHAKERPLPQKKKAQTAAAAKKLEEILPQVTKAAQAAAVQKTPSEALDKAAQLAEEALRDIVDPVNAVLSLARKQHDDLGRLDTAATLEEPKKIAETEAFIAQRQPAIVRAADKIVTRLPETEKEVARNITAAVQALERQLPEQILAAQDVAANADKELPKQKLGKNIKDMHKTLDDLTSNVERVAPLVPARDAPADSLGEQLQDLMSALANAPSNEEISNILDKYAGPLERFLAALPERDHEDEVADAVELVARQLEEKLDELQAAAEAGKPQDVERIAAEVTKKGKEFQEAAKPFIAQQEPEDQQILQDAVNDVADLVPEATTLAKEVAKNPTAREPKKKLDDVVAAVKANTKYVRGKAKPPPEVAANNAARKFPKGVKRVIDAAKEDDPNEFLNALKNLKKVNRDMGKGPGSDNPDYLGGRNIADAIAELEKRLAEKNQKKDIPDPPARVFKDAANYFQKILDDPKSLPKPSPKAEALGNIRDANNLIDRLGGAASAPKKDPKKITDPTKTLVGKMDPIIKAAKNELEKTKDAPTRKRLEDAIKDLEKLVPQLVEKVKGLVQNPTAEEPKNDYLDTLEQFKAPLAEVYQALEPNADPTSVLAKKEEAATAKLGRAAARGDPKAAQDALKGLKDAHEQFKNAAKKSAARAPEKQKNEITKAINDLDNLIKQVEPAAENLVKNKDDPMARDTVAALAKKFKSPLGKAMDAVDAVPQANEDKAVDQARQILASIKNKNIKKIDPSTLLKESRKLAQLLADMVDKTRSDILKDEDNLNDRAKAAMELEQLLAGLEGKAKNATSASSSSSQSIESLLGTIGGLSLETGSASSVASSGGAPSQFSQQISSVVKDIKVKTENKGSLEGTQLHSLSQSLASDLQKFADADSSNRRSEVIVLGRSVSSNIVKMADELKRIASLCTDPKLQDKLLQAASVMRNYATQLKILASVRAASHKSQADTTSDQLVILAKNMATLIGESTNVVSVIKQSKRGQL